MNVKYDV